MNFESNCQHVFDFWKRFCTQRFSVSVRGMLVKSDFISKLAIKSEASNSKTSLANEKESFIVYSLFVSGLSNWSQNLASL